MGDQTFEVQIDTGSSDVWVVEKGYTCRNPDTWDIVPSEKCAFGKAYTPDSTLRPIPGVNFNTSYADGEDLTGTLNYETVVMGGITVEQQELGLVHCAGWQGDGTSSGLFGFAYPTLSNVWPGTNPNADRVGGPEGQYNNLIFNMINQGVAPMFSLAAAPRNNGTGLMALGGIPANVTYTPPFIDTPLLPAIIDQKTDEPVFTYYAVNPTAFSWTNSTSGKTTTMNTSKHDTKIQNTTGSAQFSFPHSYIVDSGTTLTYIENRIVTAFATAFHPPARWSENAGGYLVPCDTAAPTFSVHFANGSILMAREELVTPWGETTCFLGVQPGNQSGKVLGGTFLKNVIAVYDIGAKMMRFAQRA